MNALQYIQATVEPGDTKYHGLDNEVRETVAALGLRGPKRSGRALVWEHPKHDVKTVFSAPTDTAPGILRTWVAGVLIVSAFTDIGVAPTYAKRVAGIKAFLESRGTEADVKEFMRHCSMISLNERNALFGFGALFPYNTL